MDSTNRYRPVRLEVWKCICGATCAPSTFKALTPMFEVVEISGMSCPTVGCAGNVAEKWMKTLDKLREELK